MERIHHRAAGRLLRHHVAADPAAITLEIAALTCRAQAAASGATRPDLPGRRPARADHLTATRIKTTLKVSWQSLGLGWQVIPAQYLYPFSLVSRLGDTYVRFLKATSLAAALSLTAAEIAYLGTAASFSVNTTDATAIAPGPAVFTPASMANIAVGSVLVIDNGSAQETVTVTATTADHLLGGRRQPPMMAPPAVHHRRPVRPRHRPGLAQLPRRPGAAPTRPRPRASPAC